MEAAASPETSAASLGEPWSYARTFRIVALAVAMLAAWAVVVAVTTPRIAFNDGLGYLDGQTYAAAVRVLRGELDVEMSAPYVYRVAPLALLAWSGAPDRAARLEVAPEVSRLPRGQLGAGTTRRAWLYVC